MTLLYTEVISQKLLYIEMLIVRCVTPVFSIIFIYSLWNYDVSPSWQRDSFNFLNHRITVCNASIRLDWPETMFSTLPFGRCVTNVCTRYFENESTDFDANWQSGPYRTSKWNCQLWGQEVKGQGQQEAEVRFGGLAEASFSTPLDRVGLRLVLKQQRWASNGAGYVRSSILVCRASAHLCRARLCYERRRLSVCLSVRPYRSKRFCLRVVQGPDSQKFLRFS